MKVSAFVIVLSSTLYSQVARESTNFDLCYHCTFGLYLLIPSYCGPLVERL